MGPGVGHAGRGDTRGRARSAETEARWGGGECVGQEGAQGAGTELGGGSPDLGVGSTGISRKGQRAGRRAAASSVGSWCLGAPELHLWGARGHQEPPGATKGSEPLRVFEAQAAASVPAAVHSRS